MDTSLTDSSSRIRRHDRDSTPVPGLTMDLKEVLVVDVAKQAVAAGEAEPFERLRMSLMK